MCVCVCVCRRVYELVREYDVSLCDVSVVRVVFWFASGGVVVVLWWCSGGVVVVLWWCSGGVLVVGW